MSNLRLEAITDLVSGRTLAAEDMAQTFDYAAGVKITSYNQIIKDVDGGLWRVNGGEPLPYFASGAGMPEGGAFQYMGDAKLRSELSAYPERIISNITLNDTSLLKLITNPDYRREGIKISTLELVDGSGLGGGTFSWDADVDKGTANGGTIIDPDYLGGFDGTVGTLSYYLAAQGSGSGVGCFVRLDLDNKIKTEWFGTKGDNSTICTAAINKAAKACVYGDTFVIGKGKNLIDGTVNLPLVDIECLGEIVVKDSQSYSLVRLQNTSPTIDINPISLTGLASGATLLGATGGALDGIDLRDYFLVLTSTEVLVNRLGHAHYTPYTKNESHNILSNKFELSDPILYNYSELSKLTVTLIPKMKPITVNNLKIKQYETFGAAVAGRSFLYVNQLYGVTFNNPDVVGDVDYTHGCLNLRHSCNLVFNMPNFNSYGTSADSYTIVNNNSCFIYFNNYVARARNAQLSQSYSGRHGNHIYFDKCQLHNFGDHWGTNYFITRTTMFDGFTNAGVNVTIDDCVSHGSMLRLGGEVRGWGDVRITNSSMYVTRGYGTYNELIGESSDIANPNGYVVASSVADNIYIKGITVYITSAAPKITNINLVRLGVVTSETYALANTFTFRTVKSLVIEDVEVVVDPAQDTFALIQMTIRHPTSNARISNVRGLKTNGDPIDIRYGGGINYDIFNLWTAQTKKESGRILFKDLNINHAATGGVFSEVTFENCHMPNQHLDFGNITRPNCSLRFKDCYVKPGLRSGASDTNKVKLYADNTVFHANSYEFFLSAIPEKLTGCALTVDSAAVTSILSGKLPFYINPASYKVS